MVKVPPYNGPPISKPISREEALRSFPRFVKTGNTVGYNETFPSDIWEDENAWNNENVWGS